MNDDKLHIGLNRRSHPSAKRSDAVELYCILPSMFERKDVFGVKKVLERGGGASDIPELLVISIIEFLFLLVDEYFAEDATAAQVSKAIHHHCCCSGGEIIS